MCCPLVFEFSVGIGGFVIGLGQISFFFSHPVIYDDLVYKLRRVKCKAIFVSSGSKIVKRLRCRKYDPVWGLLVKIFPKAFHSDLKGGWDFITGLVKTSSEETRTWSSSPLIVSRDFFSLWTWARVQNARITAYFRYFLIYYIILYSYTCTCLCTILFRTTPLWLAVSPSSL